MLTAHSSGLPRLFEVTYHKDHYPYIKAFFSMHLGAAIVVKKCKSVADLVKRLNADGIYPWQLEHKQYKQTVMLVARYESAQSYTGYWKSMNVKRTLEGVQLKGEDIGGRNYLLDEFTVKWPDNNILGMNQAQFNKLFTPEQFDRFIVRTTGRFYEYVEEPLIASGFTPTYKFTVFGAKRSTYTVYMRNYNAAK